MLTCQQITEKASQLIDGELNFSERLGIQLHVFMCKNCRGFIQKFEHIVSSLARHDEPQLDQASPEFTERVMKNLPQQEGSTNHSEENTLEASKPNRRSTDQKKRLYTD